MPNETIDTKTFIETWLEAMELRESQTWIANKLGVKRQAVSIRAWNLRNRGIDLPKLTTGGRSNTKNEIDEYNDLINKSIDRTKK